MLRSHGAAEDLLASYPRQRSVTSEPAPAHRGRLRGVGIGFGEQEGAGSGGSCRADIRRAIVRERREGAGSDHGGSGEGIPDLKMSKHTVLGHVQDRFKHFIYTVCAIGTCSGQI